MKINVTEIGSLKIYNGVVSGFSSANYLKITDSFDVSAAQSWEVVYKIKTGTSLSAQSMCGHTGSSNYDPFTIDINSSKFQLGLCKSSSSNLLKDQKGTYTVLVDTTYWLKLTFNGSRYALSYSLDGVDFIEDVVLESTTKIWTSNLVLGRQQGADSEYPFLGSIDLNECYIKINGELWWTGMVEGTQGVRVYALGIKKYKYYKEVVTEGTEWACFYHSGWGYIYFKKPYNIGDVCYYNVAENMGLVSSVSELTTGFLKISAINSDGSISCPFDVLGGSNTLKFSPYPSGDLTSTTGGLEPSTPDDYDVIKIVDSFHSLHTRGKVKYACYKMTDGSYTYYFYIAYPFNSNVKLYKHKDGPQIQALYENELSSQLLTNFELVTEEELVIAGKTFNRYYVGDLKKMDDTYVYWRRKK